MEVEAVDEGVIAKILVAGWHRGRRRSTRRSPRIAGEGAAAPPAPRLPAPTPAPSRGAAAAPAAPRPPPRCAGLSPIPKLPASTEMVKTTVREALRDAMAEEMRRDDRRLPDGRGSRRVSGRLQGHARACCRNSARVASIDTPITEHGFAGLGVGAAMAGLQPIVEFMTFNFAMQAIDHIINSAAKTLYMSGGQMRCPIVFRGPNGAAARVARAAQPGLRRLVRAVSRA